MKVKETLFTYLESSVKTIGDNGETGERFAVDFSELISKIKLLY